MLLDLPPHWLVPVFLGAAWSAGLAVTDRPPSAPHDVVVCGPDTLGEHAGADQVVACSLLPFAVRFRRTAARRGARLRPAVAGPERRVRRARPTEPGHGRLGLRERPRTQAELLEAAAATGHETGVRLLTDVHPAADAGVPAFLAPLVQGGSLVLLASATDETVGPPVSEDERATSCSGSAGQPPSG